MSFSSQERKPSITTTKTDNPENKRLSLQEQIDDLVTLAPRKSIPNDQSVPLKSSSLTSSHSRARKNSPENVELQAQAQPLPSPSSQIQPRKNSSQDYGVQPPLSGSSQIRARKDSPLQFGLQPQLSSHPSQIEARKNSLPQNPGMKSGSSQIQTLNQQQPRLSQSAQIPQAPKPPPVGMHEESGHMEVKDDTRTYGMPPGGLPAHTEESSKLLVYEWKGTKGRELESRLPPTKQKADRHDEMHLDNLPNSTADEAWTFLDAIPVKEKPVKAKPYNFLESEPLEKGDSLDSIKSIETNNNKPPYIEPDKDKDNESLSKYVSKIPEDSKKEQEVKEVVESLMSIVFSGNPIKAGGEGRKPAKEKKPPPPKPKPEPPKKNPLKKVKPPKQEQYIGQAMPQNDFLHFNQTIPTQEYALQQQQQQPQQYQQQYNQQIQGQPQVATQQQIGILPPRTTAFQAPFVPLRGINQGYPPNGSDPNIEEDDDGLKFAFNPRADCATEVTFTVEPRKRPMWQTMMNCGFTPVIYCSVPPCCLPGNGAPNAPNCCGQGQQESSSEESSSGSSEEESSDEEQGPAKNAGRGQGQARPSIKPLIVESRVVIDYNYNASEEQHPRQNRNSVVSRKFSIKSRQSERAHSIFTQSEKGDSLSFGSSSE